MNQYPHMLALDTLVWHEFLREFGPAVDRVWYDVKCGSPIAVPAAASPAEKRIAEGTGCRRIDAVCQMASELWIVEIKPLGDHTSLGQALTYVTLFGQRYRTDLWCVPVVVCAEADSDMRGMFEQEGVRLVIVDRNPL